MALVSAEEGPSARPVRGRFLVPARHLSVRTGRFYMSPEFAGKRGGLRLLLRLPSVEGSLSPIARPLCRPKNVQNDASPHASSIATGLNSF
jgi:hypothetical protein